MPQREKEILERQTKLKLKAQRAKVIRKILIIIFSVFRNPTERRGERMQSGKACEAAHRDSLSGSEMKFLLSDTSIYLCSMAEAAADPRKKSRQSKNVCIERKKERKKNIEESEQCDWGDTARAIQ